MTDDGQRKPCKDSAPGKEMLVQIGVWKSPNKWIIEVYPDPEKAPHPEIYTPGLNVPSRIKPRQVRWIVTGLTKDQYVLIKPKGNYGGIFGTEPGGADKSFKITFDDDCIQSGKPKRDVLDTLNYEYGIELWTTNDPKPIATYPPPIDRDQKLAYLDPVVVIKDE